VKKLLHIQEFIVKFLCVNEDVTNKLIVLLSQFSSAKYN